jgi:transcriptional regulator with XRE-family HTH domain
VASESTQQFPALLRRHRLLAGLSQEALAERAGLSVRGISDLERGLRRAPHPATCARLADALYLDDAAREALILAATLRLELAPTRQPQAITREPPPQRGDSTAAGTHQRLRLIERQPFLDRLDEFLADVNAGQGRFVLLGGEAGVGKSVLVQSFGDSARHRARVLIGACDPLSTPTALGPLLDVADAFGEPLTSLLANAAAGKQVFDALLAALSHGDRPTVLVFEDMHWADEATLDLMRFLGRRMAALRALLVVTYRDDEVGRAHPLRIVFGDLATFPAVRRLQLTPLSVAGVRELAQGTDLDPDELYRQTGGNPFFVTEVVAGGTREVPPSVRDAVLARAARLPAHARPVLEAAAVIGGRIEPWLLDGVMDAASEGVEACLSAGVLRDAGDVFTFRHELGRTTILDAVVSTRRVELHRRVLAALRSRPVGPDDWARLAHHADAASDAASVLLFAPIAAKRNARLRAHREAAAQYARALRYAAELGPGDRAQLFEALAYECYLTDQSAAAFDARRAALDIWTEAGERLKISENLRWLSRMSWFANRNADARSAAQAALDVLDGLSPGLQHAWAYSNLSLLCMLANDAPGACEWGDRAIALAEQLGEREVLVHALNNVGAARANSGSVEGRRQLERSLELAREGDLEEHVARAYTNLAWTAARQYQLDNAEMYLDAGSSYSSEHDLDSWFVYMQGTKARVLLLRGEWSEADALAQQLLRRTSISPVSRVNALVVLGWIGARRGDPEAWRVLDEALEVARPTNEVQRLGPVYAARAEAAWLDGNLEMARDAACAGYELAERGGDTYILAELACWRRRAGDVFELSPLAAGPFALEALGRWQEACAEWAALGCPYESALAAINGNESDVRGAVQALAGLGATRTIEAVTRRTCAS